MVIKELPDEGDEFHDEFCSLRAEVKDTEGDFITFSHGDEKEFRVPKSWVYQLVPSVLVPINTE